MFERAYSYLPPTLAMLVGAFAVSAAIGCDSGRSHDIKKLDSNQDGICDGDAEPGEPPFPTVDPEAPAHPAPVTLALDASLEKGIEAPAALRVALLHVFQPFAVYAEPVRVEVFSTDVASALPARVEIALGEAPAAVRDLQERIRGEIDRLQPGKAPAADEIPVYAYVILYDDVNGDGKAGIGTEYLTMVHPTEDSSNAEWDAYIEALHAYDERYGGLSFYEISSPTDRKNEIIAAAPLSVRFGRDSAGTEGYRLFSETRKCEEYSDGNTACKACWSNQVEISFDDAHGAAIDWHLAD